MKSKNGKVEVVRAVRELRFRAVEEMGHVARNEIMVTLRQGTYGLLVKDGRAPKGPPLVTFEYGRRSTVTASVYPDDILPA